MRKPKILILSENSCRQFKLVKTIAENAKWNTTAIVLNELNYSISMDYNKIYINNKLLNSPVIVYPIGFQAELLNTPRANDFINNWSYFLDFQASREQIISQVFSLIQLLSSNKKNCIVCNPISNFDYQIPYFTLDSLRRNGIKTAEYALTNSYSKLTNSELYKKSNYLWWMHPSSKSPIKSISKKKTPELFSAGKLPYIIMKPIEGKDLRLWYFNSEPLLGAVVYPPEYSNTREGLELFDFFKPNEVMQNFGKELGKIFSGFYEVRGILDDSGQLNIINIDFDPDISFLPTNSAEFLIKKLFNACSKSIGFLTEVDEGELSAEQERDTVFLTRMLEVQFEIIKQTF